MKVTPEELTVIANYVKELSGVTLDESKGYLVESRLGPLVEEYGCKSYYDLYTKSRSDTRNIISERIIDAITTQETLFFRDKSPFELLKFKLIPEHIDRVHKAFPSGPYSLKIWSAASSTGQEVYSISFVLKDLMLDPMKWNINILGTDISDAALAKASYARYRQFELDRGFPPEKKSLYFKPVDGEWQVKDEIRVMATFKKINLMQPLIGIGTFDIIFCRNVAIYFSQEQRKILFERLAAQLNPNGYLIIGSTESLYGVTDIFKRLEYHNSICYQVDNSVKSALH